MSGGGERREGELASGGVEGRRRGGGSRGRKGGAQARRSHGPANARPALSRSSVVCERLGSSRGGGGDLRGRRAGGRARIRGRRPLKTACKVLEIAEAGRRPAEKAARPGAAGQSRGCRRAPVPLGAGLGLTMRPAGPGRRAPVDPRLAPASTRTD